MKRIMLNLLGALMVWSALDLELSSALAQGTAFTTLTITNPTPAAGELFGIGVAAVGADRFLIGAFRDNTGAANAGAAYLFSTNGVLLATFTNPTPASFDAFGISVAELGSDRVLIGAPRDDTGSFGVGVAYLFSTNGALLTTFTNPASATGEDSFGSAIAAMGNDQVLIGAPREDTGANDAGAAYLFGTDGALLTTFINPTPTANDSFGVSVAAMGNDRVLIGAFGDSTGAPVAGAAYLFSTNGTLLTTFTNPAPAPSDFFGYSVAAIGIDRMLIGAIRGGTRFGGSVYLFSTNGGLLTTFTNPTPESGDVFGRSVAAVGSDQVLIGARDDDTGATNAGAAYLFSTNGTLLTTFTNPTPAYDDNFGGALTAVGNGRVLITAYQDDTGATNAGIAYLFSLAAQTPEAPSLNIRFTTANTIAISWPSPSTGWTLQQNTNSVASVHWSNAPGTIQDDGTSKTLIINSSAGNRFYRLLKP